MHEANFSPLALRESILVVPLGGPPSDDTARLVLDLGREGIDTTLADPIAIPAAAGDRRHAQYRAELLIARIGEFDGRRVLGVTRRDVYARDLAFTFGLAACPGRAAVISLFRLRLAPDAASFRARSQGSGARARAHARTPPTARTGDPGRIGAAFDGHRLLHRL